MSNGNSQDLDNDSKVMDSKYIQQHLANERTYLAWIRTAIAIIGVGFLVTNLHFTMSLSLSTIGDLLANVIGLTSVGLGIVTIIMATTVYLKKVEAINNQTFRTPKTTVIILSGCLVLIALVFAVYFSVYFLI